MFSSCFGRAASTQKAGRTVSARKSTPQSDPLKRGPHPGQPAQPLAAIWDIDLCQTELHGWELAAPLCFTEKLLYPLPLPLSRDFPDFSQFFHHWGTPFPADWNPSGESSLGGHKPVQASEHHTSSALWTRAVRLGSSGTPQSQKTCPIRPAGSAGSSPTPSAQTSALGARNAAWVQRHATEPKNLPYTPSQLRGQQSDPACPSKRPLGA